MLFWESARTFIWNQLCVFSSYHSWILRECRSHQSKGKLSPLSTSMPRELYHTHPHTVYFLPVSKSLPPYQNFPRFHWINIPYFLPWTCVGCNIVPTPFFFLFFLYIYCSGFCHTLWISHGFTCVPHPDAASRLPPHPIPLGLPSAPAPSTCLMHPTWAGWGEVGVEIKSIC